MSKEEKAAYMREWHKRRREHNPERHALALDRQRKYARAKYAANLDSSRLYNREKMRRRYAEGKIPSGAQSRRTNPVEAAQHRAYMKKYNLENASRLVKQTTDCRRRREYGLNRDEYEQMLAAQGGVCAICGGAPKKKSLAVDHVHSSGKVRALLCHRCNTALGLFGEDTDRLMSAINYLKRFS